VTTRRCNARRFGGLRRFDSAPAAQPLGLGVLGFDLFIQASAGLPLGRLPAPELALAIRVLAVMLVPTPRQVFSSTAFAQAYADPRSSRGTWFEFATNDSTPAGAVISQGIVRGERDYVLLGRLSTPVSGPIASVYFRAGRRQ
jgi:hypothetical protein